MITSRAMSTCDSVPELEGTAIDKVVAQRVVREADSREEPES
jgi:hypothetical protein